MTFDEKQKQAEKYSDTLRALADDALINRSQSADVIDALKAGAESLEAPTIDAVPVKHGRWEQCCNLMGEYFKCSECEYKAEVPTCMGEPIFTYCPNCGAKMDLKDGESE